MSTYKPIVWLCRPPICSLWIRARLTFGDAKHIFVPFSNGFSLITSPTDSVSFDEASNSSRWPLGRKCSLSLVLWPFKAVTNQRGSNSVIQSWSKESRWFPGLSGDRICHAFRNDSSLIWGNSKLDSKTTVRLDLCLFVFNEFALSYNWVDLGYAIWLQKSWSLVLNIVERNNIGSFIGCPTWYNKTNGVFSNNRSKLWWKSLLDLKGLSYDHSMCVERHKLIRNHYLIWTIRYVISTWSELYDT